MPEGPLGLNRPFVGCRGWIIIKTPQQRVSLREAQEIQELIEEKIGFQPDRIIHNQKQFEDLLSTTLLDDDDLAEAFGAIFGESLEDLFFDGIAVNLNSQNLVTGEQIDIVKGVVKEIKNLDEPIYYFVLAG